MPPVALWAGLGGLSWLFFGFSSYCFTSHQFPHNTAGGGIVYASILLTAKYIQMKTDTQVI